MTLYQIDPIDAGRMIASDETMTAPLTVYIGGKKIKEVIDVLVEREPKDIAIDVMYFPKRKPLLLVSFECVGIAPKKKDLAHGLPKLTYDGELRQLGDWFEIETDCGMQWARVDRMQPYDFDGVAWVQIGVYDCRGEI
jgi:hypothetical protein